MASNLGGHVRNALDLVATVATVTVSVLLISALWSSRRGAGEDSVQARDRNTSTAAKPALPDAPLSFSPNVATALDSARVGMIEYSDFQCPFCSRFARTTLPTIRERYVRTGQVRYDMRQLPIESKHPHALSAAAASVCAGRQGLFWEMHDALFQRPLEADSTSRYASRLGLDTPEFRDCLAGDGLRQVREDMHLAAELDVSSTPTFFFGTIEKDGRLRVLRRERGAMPQQALSKILDQLLVGSQAGLE